MNDSFVYRDSGICNSPFAIKYFPWIYNTLRVIYIIMISLSTNSSRTSGLSVITIGERSLLNGSKVSPPVCIQALITTYLGFNEFNSSVLSFYFLTEHFYANKCETAKGLCNFNGKR